MSFIKYNFLYLVFFFNKVSLYIHYLKIFKGNYDVLITKKFLLIFIQR